MRVIDLCRNAVVTQILLQSIPLAGADRELVVNVDRFRWSWRRIDMGIKRILNKKLPIAIRIMTPTRSPLIQMEEFDSQDGSLQSIESTIYSQQFVLILCPTPMQAQHPELLCQPWIIGCNQTTIARPTKILGWKEAEAADGPNPTHGFAFVLRSHGLGSILNNG